MNEYNQKKLVAFESFFHPWILRRARSAAGALVGFIFILRQQSSAKLQSSTAPHRTTEIYSVALWCGVEQH